MYDELQAGELRPLPNRVEAVRRRWFSDWTTDEGLQYVFARGDIRTVLEGYDALIARIAELEGDAPPIDDILSLIVRQFFQVERGQDERLDRVWAWLDRVRPVEEPPS